MLSAVPASGIANSMIRITGIGDHDRPEWLIRINGMRTHMAFPGLSMVDSPYGHGRDPGRDGGINRERTYDQS